MPFAVHISDGILAWPMLAAGFAVAAVLAGLAAWRVRENEIPRIALMTAAFFVASSIHVKLGPTSAHLLLNGLVGVVLGRRAPLAILVGITLQALLIPHGGISTIGVNACAEMIPALLAAALFALVSSVSDERRWFRSLLVGITSVIWGWCLLFGIAVLFTVPLGEVVSFSGKGGLVVRVNELSPALALAAHPLALLALGVFTLAVVLIERRVNTSAGFPRGALVGVLGVLGTAGLSAAVLLLGAGGDVSGLDTWVAALFVAHLPLALIEGLIVGCVVAFLWRVKPQMLGSKLDLRAAGLLAVLALFTSGSPARAHALEIEKTIDRQKREVTIRCAYDTGDPPVVATVRVFDRKDNKLIAEGRTDKKGRFVFRYDTPRDFRVEARDTVGDSAGGHRETVPITEAELIGDTTVTTREGSRLRDLIAGVALVLAAAAFVLAWRNSVRIARLEEAARSQTFSPK